MASSIDWAKRYREGATTTAFAPTSESNALTSDQEQRIATVIEHFDADAYTIPDQPEEKAALTEDEKIFLSRDQIQRFLIATKWDAAATIKRIDACLTWRRSVDIYDIVGFAARVENEFAETLGQIVFGFGKGGQPCIIMVPARRQHPPSELGLLHLFFLMEICYSLMPAGVSKIIFVVDLAGKRKHSVPLGLAKEWVTILSAHYVECLGTGIIVNMPMVFRLLLSALWPFIDPVTKTKIAVSSSVAPGGAEGSVSALIDPQQLQKEFGGEVDLPPSLETHNEYWKAMIEVSLERREAYRQNWRKLGGKVGLSAVACKLA